jgi:C4-dicarboxylate-specific signal transduction histidine kinase
MAHAGRRNVSVSLVLLLLAISAWANEPRGREILVLSPAEPHRPSISSFVIGLQAGLDRELPGTNILVVEQAASWEDTAGNVGVRQWFDEKYRNREFDAIVAIGSADLDIALRLRSERWPRTKIFYARWPQEAGAFVRPHDTAGILADYVPMRSARTALELFPDTKQLFAIGGGSPADRAYNKRLIGQIEAAYPHLQFTDLTSLRLRDMIARTAQLPPHSAIVVLNTIADVEGNPIDIPKLVSATASVADAPIFDNVDLSFGSGIVGGPILNWEQFGTELAPQVAKVFEGRDPNSLPEIVLHPKLRFDARQLKKWGISESRLPPGSAIEFQTPTLWSEHRGLILVTLFVVALQAVMIALLLLQRRRLLLSQLARTESERALHSQEALNQAVLRSLPGYVSILDDAGKILQVNERWREAGSDIAGGFFTKNMPGDDYASSWDQSSAARNDFSELLGRQVRSVLNGQTSQAVLEWQSSGEDSAVRWFEIRCDALQWPQGGAVLSHLDITERKKTEMQAQTNLQALSQFHRVATLGELAGALAHELNQPLASILINAETLKELLALDAHRNSEASEIVDEIISDDDRAGQIIRKMRALLQGRESTGVPLSLTDIAASVVKLLSNEAMLRRVVVRCKLAENLPSVLGDTVQLQQVVLNLILNAMDAVRDLPERDRTVTVSTFPDAYDTVVLEIRDTGPGISPNHMPHLFDHFFTTKQDGLGLGLSISKSIVESFHGKIEADNCTEGARFRVYMPVVQLNVLAGIPA